MQRFPALFFNTLFIFLVILILTVGMLIIRTFLLPVETIHITADVHVKNRAIGFNLDTDALHFGTVMPGARAERAVTLTNPYAFPVKVIVKADPNEWISLSQNPFYIPPHASRSVLFTLHVPDTARPGSRVWNLTFFLYRAWPFVSPDE